MTGAPLSLPGDRDPSGRDLGHAELENLIAVIRSARLNATGATWVARLEKEFAKRMGASFAIAGASGTAALHAALAALALAPGDEVVTTPITDIGAILPILYEGAVPRFCDVDPQTLNVTAATIARELGPRTRAIVATHLFGGPCELRAPARRSRAGVPGASGRHAGRQGRRARRLQLAAGQAHDHR